MFSIGDFVFDTQTGANVQIMERIELWGYTSYKVFNPSTGNVYRATEEQLHMGGNEAQLDENYLRYVVLLSKIKNETASGILSSLSSGIIPLPHQLHVLNRALETNNIRYILADEVGLGKTIETGMIIKELKARGLVKRILVVCPTGLVSQWSAEMQEKFHEKFQVILPSDFETIRRLTDNDDVYGQFDQVISPMDSIKPVEKHAGWSDERVEKYNQERIEAIINSGWDLIIIDEAHRVAGSSSDVARYKLGYLLSQASPYLLLLTATPHNGKTEPFLRLVRLLDEQAFPNYKSIVKEQVAPYLIRTEKREAIDNNGNLLFKKRYTHLVELHWDERHSLQRQLYELVSSYVSKTYDIISESFGGIEYEQSAMFAMIPSTTSISRQCLLSGKFPSQLWEPWIQSKEKAEFTACAKALGYTDSQIGYARGYDAEFNAFVKCGAVIINDVDDLVHAQPQGRLGMYNDISVLANEKKLRHLVERLLSNGFDVYITADHGNTQCTGIGKYVGAGVDIETKSHRMVVLKNFADKGKLKDRFGLVEYPKYYLPKEYEYLICDAGTSLDVSGEQVMTHGGMTIDEVVVPFIKIKAEKTHG